MKNVRRMLLVMVLTLGAGACSGSILGPDEHTVDSGSHTVDSGSHTADSGS